MDRSMRRDLIERLNRDAATLSARFGLIYRSIEAERAGVKRRYGICYSDGTIRIRLVHAVTGRPLRYSSLVDTLCHELAHLRHFDHGPRFKRFYLTLLDHARQAGIYRPKPRTGSAAVGPLVAAGGGGGTPVRAPARPHQLDLFEESGAGAA
jgi:predicted metal-dependent hydrolase